MSFCSEYVLEEIQNCYNISKCLPSTKEGFLAKKIRKLVKVSISNSLFYYLLFKKKLVLTWFSMKKIDVGIWKVIY